MFLYAVELATTSHSKNNLIFDRTPPHPGWISDGDSRDCDIDFTSVNYSICATWDDFYDEDSEIDMQDGLLGVGSQPNLTDIVPLTSVIYGNKSKCVNLNMTLHHQQRYYVTIVVFNDATSHAATNLSSNGGITLVFFQ